MRFKAELEIYTPVIINSGDVFEFCEFIPRKAKESGFASYSHMDTATLFDGLPSSVVSNFIATSSNALITRDNKTLKEQRNIIAANANAKSIYTGTLLPLAYKELSDKPVQKIDKIMMDSLTSKPYIPGSSIKGAMRTAILEFLRKEKGCRDDWRERDSDRENKVYESLLLSGAERMNVSDDPFKNIKVTDFRVLKRRNVDGVEKRVRPSIVIGKIGEDEKMPIYSAMTDANCFCNDNERIVAVGNITIDDKYLKALFPDAKEPHKRFFDYISDFYIDNINHDKTRTAIKRSPGMQRIFRLFCSDVEKNNSYVLRLGHYIGIQNYTFKVLQKRPPRKASEKINIDGGRIITIEGGYIPSFCLLKLEEMK